MKNKLLHMSFSIGLCMAILFFFSFMPIRPLKFVAAQGLGGLGGIGEISYGGMGIITIICTCSANELVYLIDYKTSMLLALIYQPGASVLYSNYNTYGRYFLGSYLMGAGSCQMYVGISCEELRADGQMGMFPGTGTSN